MARGRFTVFALSRQIEKTGDSRVEETFELQKDDRKTVLDLKDVGVINRDANALFRGM